MTDCVFIWEISLAAHPLFCIRITWKSSVARIPYNPPLFVVVTDPRRRPRPTTAGKGSPFLFTLCLLLRGSLGLGGLLPVAPDHNHGQERTDDGAAEEDEDDGDADGPDPGREEVLERVVVVDERLGETLDVRVSSLALSLWDQAFIPR